MLLKRTFYNKQLGNKLTLSLREIKFSDKKFNTEIFVFNIIYHHIGFQIDNHFYLFYN